MSKPENTTGGREERKRKTGKGGRRKHERFATTRGGIGNQSLIVVQEGKQHKMREKKSDRRGKDEGSYRDDVRRSYDRRKAKKRAWY